MAKFCSKCGNPLGANAVFCPSCGAKIEDGGQLSTQPAAAPTEAAPIVNAAPIPKPQGTGEKPVFVEKGFTGKFFSFEGRLNRKRYWTRVLSVGACYILLSLVGAIFAEVDPILAIVVVGALPTLLFPVVVCMGISLLVRRMHDVNKPGWYALIPFYSLYLALIRGTVGDNLYGPDPLGGES